jgi:hypothetical protein
MLPSFDISNLKFVNTAFNYFPIEENLENNVPHKVNIFIIFRS